MKEDATPGFVVITIDPAEKLPVPNGVFDPLTRELVFSVIGEGAVEISDFDLKGIWLPDSPDGSIDRAQFIGDDFPYPGSRRITAGESARLLTFERNIFDIERVYRVTVRPDDGDAYEPEGEHSPPRMVVPRKR